MKPSRPPIRVAPERIPALSLWQHVRRTPGCWLWTGPVDKARYGYPRCHIPGNGYYMAHRAIYELLVGPIPAGLTLDHLCRTPLCVNPEHMDPVSLTENILRGSGPGATNARKTACKRGHPFVEGSFWYSGQRRARICRVCHNETNRRNDHKRRARLVEAPEQMSLGVAS